MYTIFIEYKVNQSYISEYNQAIQKVQQLLKEEQITSYKRYVATDQGPLYVEMLQVKSLSLYHKWREMMRNEDVHFPWNKISPYILGGITKFNMWSFEEL